MQPPIVGMFAFERQAASLHELANSAWALAKLDHRDEPLLQGTLVLSVDLIAVSIGLYESGTTVKFCEGISAEVRRRVAGSQQASLLHRETSFDAISSPSDSCPSQATTNQAMSVRDIQRLR